MATGESNRKRPKTTNETGNITNYPPSPTDIDA